jgi:hypothetical protein
MSRGKGDHDRAEDCLTMQFLFNSGGRCIAIETNRRLHSIGGRNIGRYLADQHIFVDNDGRYLGEIVQDNGLMWRDNSLHQQVNYGASIDYVSIGEFANSHHRTGSNSCSAAEGFE